MKGIKGLLLSLLILSIIFLATYFIFYYRVYKITLKVKGDSEVKVLYGSKYVDIGAAANKCTLAKCIDISYRCAGSNI